MPNPSITSSPYPLPEEIRNLLADVETFVADILRGENLSKKAKEKREFLIKKIKDVKSIYLQEFQGKGDVEDGEEYDDPFAGASDTISLASECYDKDDEAPSDGQFPPIPAQDLPFVLKAGYLEKRRKDHSFLGFEWQKRWCALSKTVFYYYGSDKDKQQKGEFAIDGYNVRMNNTLRKDGKKDCCFEISAPDKRVYQFTAASPKDAEEWVQQLNFVLQDMESDIIPEDDDERGELYDDVDHPLPVGSAPIRSQPIDDEIYEELPEEEEDSTVVKMEEQRKMGQDSVHHTLGDKSTDYANFYQGLWDCTGTVSDELSFKRGDVIYILSKEYNRYGWWVGEMKGAIGLVPKAYIMEMYDI
ncbi:src kinase-associated phosphoprotein 2 isoform X2 [Nycticebus coucang]|uniref:src kinase-associated phosphoprotein 2 isoform X2 n=1 Tax=Nycticebus coucang TaxID=9470 RepID=UPI00234E324E|nr:src kinase-associated phosphoprotein 2 isoform X2 [Nycticebus coucang]XP_053465523.1 src kinase-associated phosphoprotein 2 isoform X2 [Nycticebus coucang]